MSQEFASHADDAVQTGVVLIPLLITPKREGAFAVTADGKRVLAQSDAEAA